MFVLKDFVRGCFVAEIRAGAYILASISVTKLRRVKSLATSAYAYERCTNHQNQAFKVVARTVETGLRYFIKKTFSNAQKRERQNHSQNFVRLKTFFDDISVQFQPDRSG